MAQHAQEGEWPSLEALIEAESIACQMVDAAQEFRVGLLTQIAAMSAESGTVTR